MKRLLILSLISPALLAQDAAQEVHQRPVLRRELEAQGLDRLDDDDLELRTPRAQRAPWPQRCIPQWAIAC